MIKINLKESVALVVSPNVKKSSIKLIYSKSLVKKSRNRASKWLYIQKDCMVNGYALRSFVWEIEF
jgi:hypothetical protein